MYHPERSTGDVTGTITLDGQLYNYIIRAQSVDSSVSSFNIWFAWQYNQVGAGGMQASANPIKTDWTESPSFGAYFNSEVNPAYVVDSHEIKKTCVLNFGSGNYTDGIKSIPVITPWGTYAANFELDSDPTKGILKDDTKELTINWTFSYGRKV